MIIEGEAPEKVIDEVCIIDEYDPYICTAVPVRVLVPAPPPVTDIPPVYCDACTEFIRSFDPSRSKGEGGASRSITDISLIRAMLKQWMVVSPIARADASDVCILFNNLCVALELHSIGRYMLSEIMKKIGIPTYRCNGQETILYNGIGFKYRRMIGRRAPILTRHLAFNTLQTFSDLYLEESPGGTSSYNEINNLLGEWGGGDGHITSRQVTQYMKSKGYGIFMYGRERWYVGIRIKGV